MASDVLSLRIDHQLKNEGNVILDKMGLSPSSFITMAYRKLVSQRDIPFETKVSESELHQIPNTDTMSAVEFQAEIEKGLADIDADRTRSFGEVKAEMRSRYGF